ncbi:Uncharacterised protein [Mycobacteroides abscessus subsp. abscessus]|nr:Uncharacterised protein [Mycobacteroides abscessus subsp. abscessus]
MIFKKAAFLFKYFGSLPYSIACSNREKGDIIHFPATSRLQIIGKAQKWLSLLSWKIKYL